MNAYASGVEVEVVLQLAPEVDDAAVEALAEAIGARASMFWDVVGYDHHRHDRRLTLLLSGTDAQMLAMVLPLAEPFAGPGSHYVIHTADGRTLRQDFGALPDWLDAPLHAVLHDLQQPRAVEQTLGWIPPVDSEFGSVWLSEIGQDDTTAMSIAPLEPAEDLKVMIADWLQEQWFPETAAAWAEARPACPGHTHPASPGILDDIAVWHCPQTGTVLARIGEL